MTQYQENKFTRRSVYLKKRPYRKIIPSANGMAVVWLPKSQTPTTGHRLLIRLASGLNPSTHQNLNRQHRIVLSNRDMILEKPEEVIPPAINPDDWGIFEDPLLPLGAWNVQPAVTQSPVQRNPIPQDSPPKTIIAEKTAPVRPPKPTEAPKPDVQVAPESIGKKSHESPSPATPPAPVIEVPAKEIPPLEKVSPSPVSSGYSDPHVDRQGGLIGFLSRIFKS
ncbi:MAG: hypothetical protein LR011_10860 [Verrucomicrobia bacterium]|nr:hypothetical protein [Verrucomicrobiota bacterium]